MVIGEAAMIGLIGGILGVALGCGVVQLGNQVIPQAIQAGIPEIAGPWLVLLVLASIFIGLLSGLIPALRASSLSVVDGLRRVV